MRPHPQRIGQRGAESPSAPEEPSLSVPLTATGWCDASWDDPKVTRARLLLMTVPLTLLVFGFGGCGSDDAAGERTTTTSTGLSACEDRLSAYFEPTATPEQLEDAEAAIRGVDQVSEVEFFDQDETFEEMHDLFAEASPELLENVDPDDLPSSFRVRVTVVEPSMRSSSCSRPSRHSAR